MGIAIGPKLVTCFLPTHPTCCRGRARPKYISLGSSWALWAYQTRRRLGFWAPKVWAEIKAN